MLSEDKMFERMVAAVCVAKDNGAKVKYNYKLGGRQFDVALFTKSGLFRYFTLIEAKSSKRPIVVKEVEAFCTKGYDKGANKLALFSANGYESGCKEVAERHRIDLFRLSFSDRLPDANSMRSMLRNRTSLVRGGARATEPPHIEIGEETDAIAIVSIKAIYADGREIELPEEQTQLSYVANRTVDGNGKSINDYIQSIRLEAQVSEKEYQKEIWLEAPVSFKAKDQFFIKGGVIRGFVIKYLLHKVYPVSGNIEIELTSFVNDVVIENCMTGEIEEVPFYNLSLGLEPFVSGKYYFLPAPLQYFFCETVTNGMAKVYLLESFQMNELLQTSFEQEAIYGTGYIPLRDSRIIDRLRQRYQRFKHLESQELR